MTDHRNHRPATARRRTIAALAAVVLPIGSALAQGGSGEKLENTRAALEKNVETRRIISEEKRDWAVGKEMLVDRIGLVKREIGALRERIRDAEASITEADRKAVDLVAENDRLKAASAALTASVEPLEQRVRKLLARLPEPLREKVRPLSQRIPEDPADTRLSLSERFQNVVGILDQVNKFNREITVNSEVRTLADGSSVEVTALYVGIGQGYYVNAKGDIAGFGTATADAWVWTPANEAGPAIAKEIAIFENEAVASFVRLPIRIQKQER
jgi:hypothetical protein